MYELKNGSTFVRLSDDLEMLEYGRGDLVYRTAAPIRLDWTGIPVGPNNMGRKDVIATADAIRIDFADVTFAARFPGNTYCRPEPRFTPDLRFSVTLRLDGDDLIINATPIENIGDCKLHLLLAQGLLRASTQEKAQLYIPYHYGMRFDFPRNDTYSTAYQPGAAWALPVHGIFKPTGGIGLWCEDPDRDYAVSYNMDRAGTVSAVCREIYDSLANEPRELRFMLFDAGSDFRDLCRRCRELRIASGRFKTLEQKAKEHPVVGELPGTVFWKHNVYFRERPAGVDKTWSLYVGRPDWNETEGLPGNWTAAEVFETAKERGFDRVAVCNTGWNRDGYDAGYPTRLPVNPERGTNEDFREAAKAAQKLSPGYFLNIHDNYIDAYRGEEFDPADMMQVLPGNPTLGGVWRGGQAWRLCSVSGLKFAKRDLPRIAELSGPGCIYIDVSGGVPLYPCHSPLHPQTRRQDWLTKREMFEFARDTIGALAVEDCGTDHFADVVDIGAYGALHFSGLSPRADGPVPVPVPMWQMVYHDSVLNYFGEGYSPVHGSEYQLYQAILTLLPTGFDDHSRRLSLDLRSAYSAAMVDFETLTAHYVTIDDDGSFHTHGVVRTAFSDGTAVIANFDDAPYVYDGEEIPARDFIIRREK